jgi:hypothetical protein
VGDTVIENPILNGPYDERTRHWAFDDDAMGKQLPLPSPGTPTRPA